MLPALRLLLLPVDMLLFALCFASSPYGASPRCLSTCFALLRLVPRLVEVVGESESWGGCPGRLPSPSVFIPPQFVGGWGV